MESTRSLQRGLSYPAIPADSFPKGVVYREHPKNPAIQIFGHRLFNDQSPTELLVEFLLIAVSDKRISGNGEGGFATPLPTLQSLADWPTDAYLQYAPRARLNLKLFAFMGASRLDSRHETHREHYKQLLQGLESNIRVTEGNSESDVLRTLENLFLGFQGAGGGRTWCARSFLPVCPGFLAGETIWNESAARRDNPRDWEDLLEDLRRYFCQDKHLFLARGGEVLYLHLCNALRQPHAKVQAWAEESGVHLERDEVNPAWLHSELQRELSQLMMHCPQTVTDIAEFIDSGVEQETAKATDSRDGEPRFVDAGWCPVESWQEGYLLAVELLRLCMADLDLVERIKLLENAFALHVLRSLALQSARHCSGERRIPWPGYLLAVSAPEEMRMAVKRISQHTVKAVEKLVYHAIRCGADHLPSDETERNRILKEADTRYGGKMFITTAKRIGLLVPRRGAGTRFTLNEDLLRVLVATIVPVGGRLTYDKFKELAQARYGLVFDADGFSRASAWADGVDDVHLGSHCDVWMQEMLAAAGLLIHLSDSCALVENPAGRGDSE